MRKIIATGLVSTLLIAGVLTGCGSKSSETSDVTKITVWGMGEEAKSLPKMVEQFENDNPTIKVEVQALPWDTAHDKLLTAVASKKGPDVVQMGTTWIPEFANAKALMDLTPHLDKYPGLKQDNYYPGSVETATFKDAYVGVPWYIDTRVLYYRTDILEEVGYDHAPTTWAELQDVSKKLSERGKGKYGYAPDVKEQTVSFMFARQNGSKLFSDDGKPLFNQPEFVDTVKFMNSFFENGSPVDLGLDAIQGFRGEGVLPIFISGPWMVQMIKDQAPELDGKWATAVLPAGKDNNSSSLGGSNLSVFQYTEHADAALKFVEYMTDPESQLKWMDLTKSLPSAKESWKASILQEDANYKVFGEQLETAVPMPSTKEFEEIAQNFLSSFEKIYRNKGADVQKEMDDFNKKAETIINK